MKTLTSLACSILCVFLLVSCNSSPDIYKAEELNGTLKSKIDEQIKPQTIVQDLFLNCGSTSYVNSEIGFANLYYLADDGTYRVSYIPFAVGGDPTDKENITRVGMLDSHKKKDANGKIIGQGRSIADYDYSIIAKNISTATEIATSKGYPVSGIESYKVTFYEDPSQDEHSFTILCKTEKGTEFNGRKIVTSYYELQCKGDANGNVVILDLE